MSKVVAAVVAIRWIAMGEQAQVGGQHGHHDGQTGGWGSGEADQNRHGNDDQDRCGGRQAQQTVHHDLMIGGGGPCTTEASPPR